MNSIPLTNQLIESSRWHQFVDSTAVGLRLNLLCYSSDYVSDIAACQNCPVCHQKHPDLSCHDKSEVIKASLKEHTQEMITAGHNPTIVFTLGCGLIVVARDFTCCSQSCQIPFADRVNIAKELLDSFVTLYAEQSNGSQLAVELSALRHMNHILLSMFRGENNALERAIDLILSAVIILFDACGSYLSYNIDGRPYLLMKGDVESLSGQLVVIGDDSLICEIDTPIVKGKLGLSVAHDKERAAAFLPLLVQECEIAFEIDHLMNLMESKLTLVLEAVGSLIMLVDRRMNICYANKAAENLLGMQAKDILGVSFTNIEAPWSLLRSSDLKRHAKGIRDIYKGTGGVRYIDWNVYPLNDCDVESFIIVAEDRTDFYRLQELGDRSEHMADISNMISCLAHEIRNPLATFRGMLQLINHICANGEVDVSKYIGIGFKELDKVTRLLNNCLVMGKLPDTSEGPVNLQQFISGFLPVIGSEIAGSGFEILSDIESVPPVNVDKKQLSQVLLNLVRNAAEYLPPDGRIMIGLHAYQNQWVRITVHDNGPGISGDPEKLFKPFYTTKPDGAGLGLAISRAIVNSHGGQISAENHPEGGAIFSINLPLPVPQKETRSNIEVLYISDEKLERIPVGQVLRGAGYKVISVVDVDNALFMSKRFSPSVIAMDDRFLDERVYKNIKRVYPEAMILAVGECEALKGAKDICYLPKPFNYAQLVNKIENMDYPMATS